MSESSLTSEQLPNMNPAAEKSRLRREHLKRIGDLAVQGLAEYEDEALIERTREHAILREIREFGQTEFITEPIKVIEQETIRVLPDQFLIVRTRLVEFANDGLVLSESFLEQVHTDAEIGRDILDLAIDQLRQEGLITHTAAGYVKAPTGDDYKAWLDATLTGPINVQRSNN